VIPPLFDLIVIGGGAAGFFAAIAAKEISPQSSVLILEKTSSPLAKVRISGGGRCNVTHACFDARQLAKNYPSAASNHVIRWSGFPQGEWT
jgi:predicted flavoprotein YhiN